MAHHHHEHENDAYYIDQLCMVGLSGAFGAICLSMYFWNTSMIKLLLGEQFHPFVLGSGVVLLLLALIRGATLWVESGADEHQHDHHAESIASGTPPISATAITAPHHHHDGVACDHDHSHEHDHGPEDHEHGWAPWRYVVLLVPIILFFLGLPNKGPKAADYKIDLTAESQKEAMSAASLIGMPSFSQAAYLHQSFANQPAGDEIGADFKTVMKSIEDPVQREFYKGKNVTLRGQFVPASQDARYFALVRFRLQCCAADAVDLRLDAVSRKAITDVKRDAWVEVKAKIEYVRRGPNFAVRLVLQDEAAIRPCLPDTNYYLQ